MKVSIPEELSVIGFDDSPMAARLTPSLTTIRQPIREMGRLAAAKLIPPKGPEDTETAAASRMTLHLVVRDSSQPPK
jgi:LacI family transcriptional regulator